MQVLLYFYYKKTFSDFKKYVNKYTVVANGTNQYNVLIEYDDNNNTNLNIIKNKYKYETNTDTLLLYYEAIKDIRRIINNINKGIGKNLAGSIYYDIKHIKRKNGTIKVKL